MSVPSPRAVVRANAVSHLARYRDPNAARALAERHPRLAELSLSFPALFSALAVPRARFDPEPVIARVMEGAPLAALAMEARVPMWLRKLTPETCVMPLPALPDSLYLRRRIVNHLPRRKRQAKLWFEVVADAAAHGTEPFMVWCARLVMAGSRRPLKRQSLLGLWAWFSERPQAQAYRFIDKPWSPEMELKAALAGADAWLRAVTLYLELDDEPIADMWFAPGRVDGYDFVPLDSAAAITAEADAMENCLRTYGESVATGRSRLWSVRRDGARVATMRVCWRRQDPLPVVGELLHARNRRAPAAIWLAARKWLLQQDLARLDWETHKDRPWRDLDRRRWAALWRPYWVDKRRFPGWLPLRASRDALADL